MEKLNTRFIIGIDLGTTNCAVSYVDLSGEEGGGKEKKPQIRLFRVPQLTGAGEITSASVLPSFLYIPGEYDISKESIVHPWKKKEASFAGVFARDHGAKVPSRLVSSAKSWLCHGNVDRHAKILPWGAGDEVAKVSPVQASAAYLNHIRQAWNRSRGDDEDLYLENQLIVITVPASFDEVARDLTILASKEAGLHHVTLIEEPLAAFYAWLIRHEESWSRHVSPGELILVCDVGGGTSDFTLITLREVDGSPRFERIAVGDHLILGGDNIDLALARHVESHFGSNRAKLTGDRWKTLCHECRKAKERILDGASDAEKITLMGEGGKLIAGTMSATLTRKELEEIVLSGFFPPVDKNEPRKESVRKGITEFGLPYEQEPAITRHLGWFLTRHEAEIQAMLGKTALPDLILFNGGSLKPAIIQEGIREAIRRWFGVDDAAIPRILENPDPDLAVALGASYYGLVKTGKGVKVGSGSARSYYLGVSLKTEARSEIDDHVICLVERGLDEGSAIALPERRFEVLANQPVSFDIYSSSYRAFDRCGNVIKIDDTFTPLPPVQTIVQYGKKGEKTAIPVAIEGRYTEMGTLSLWCRSLVSQNRWQLQFQLRDVSRKAGVGDTEIFDAGMVEGVIEEITRAFSDGADKQARVGLIKRVTAILERPREKWPLFVIRQMADALLMMKESRSFSADHEARWLNLVGFSLRPGFGDGFDETRIQQLWKIYQAGMTFSNSPQVRSEWWIMIRRIAGGLKPGHQRQIFQDISPALLPRKGASQKLQAHEQVEMWMAAANLEKLSVKDKIKASQALMEELQGKKVPHQLLWALSRLGARELLYGSVDRVVPPDIAAVWINTILSREWKEAKPVGAALAQLGRATGDRSRDIDPGVTAKVIAWMEERGGFSSEARYLKQVIPREAVEESAIFGESLPSGLMLHE